MLGIFDGKVESLGRAKRAIGKTVIGNDLRKIFSNKAFTIDLWDMVNDIDEGVVFANYHPMPRSSFFSLNLVYKVSSRFFYTPSLANIKRDLTKSKLSKNGIDSKEFIDIVAQKRLKTLFPDFYIFIRTSEELGFTKSVVYQVGFNKKDIDFFPMTNLYSYSDLIENFNIPKELKLKLFKMCIGHGLSDHNKICNTSDRICQNIEEIINIIMTSEPNSDLSLPDSLESVLYHLKKSMKKDIFYSQSGRQIPLQILLLWYNHKLSGDISIQDGLDIMKNIKEHIHQNSYKGLSNMIIEDLIEYDPIFKKVFLVE